MSLFFKSNRSWIIFIFMLTGLSAGMYWMDGYRDIMLILYAFFLTAILLTVFLSIRFYTHRHLFQRLSRQPSDEADSAFFQTEGAILSRFFENYLYHQYRLYQAKLQTLVNKNHDRSIFINQWVHQMKIPVSVIDLIVQENANPAFRSIQEESDRMKSGLNTVLYMLRLDHFESDFVVEPARLLDLVNETVNDCKKLFIRHKLYPKVEIAERSIIETDKKWFQFALNQLITNAIKYSPEPGSQIIILGKKQENQWILTIADHGIGIETADLPRVFRPFFTGENGRKYSQSTGMGLYLTKEICEKLGYRISVASRLNQGTKMTITIPCFSLHSPSLTKM